MDFVIDLNHAAAEIVSRLPTWATDVVQQWQHDVLDAGPQRWRFGQRGGPGATSPPKRSGV
ncbi:hypothetical protein [Nocardia tengchongensis]|uniref:hypothetical protein n=1 Tax=Nocardia tengchongensis TaxID=2055889 RepID=UPI003664D355